MISPLAEIDLTTVGALAQGATALLTLALLFTQYLRSQSGRDGERQIEPTALHAITSELKAQTLTLNKLDRESGERGAVVTAIADKLGHLERIQRDDIDKLHARVGGISRELASTVARVDGIEKR